MFTLYHFPRTAGFAPHCLLQQVGAPYELVFVDMEAQAQKTDEYLAINPAGRIPALVHNGQTLFESPAICIYISELYPEHYLIPPIGDAMRASFFQWLAFLNNTLQAEILIFYHPERHTLQPSSVNEVKTAVQGQIAQALGVINDHLADRTYMLGDTLTACDYFLFMLADWALPVEPSVLSYTHLARYLKHMAKDPIVEAVCQKEGIDLTPFL